MNLFLTIVFLSLTLIVFFKIRFKSKRNLKRKSNFKLIEWMELTNEERREMDSFDNRETMKRKKLLLKSIREEYQKLKKK